MILRKERISLPVGEPLRILHISDVHFSAGTTHEQNEKVSHEILRLARECGNTDAVCVTGDLISRRMGDTALADALSLMTALRETAPVFYSLGNHETDLPPQERETLLRAMEARDITLLDNRTVSLGSWHITGLTLPGAVYKNPGGGYSRLAPVTPEMLRKCVGEVQKPCILLAHTPLGFAAYAQWGASLVLSGHVHGGIVRIGNVGLLSPERRFLPKYTKGLFSDPASGCIMNVSAGIGKLRVNNPAELICIGILPEPGKE